MSVARKNSAGDTYSQIGRPELLQDKQKSGFQNWCVRGVSREMGVNQVGRLDGDQKGRMSRPLPCYTCLLDVSCLAIRRNTPKRTSNRGLWRPAVHEASRTRSFDSAHDPHKFYFFERAITAAEIRFEDKTGFGLVYRLAHNSRLEA